MVRRWKFYFALLHRDHVFSAGVRQVRVERTRNTSTWTDGYKEYKASFDDFENSLRSIIIIAVVIRCFVSTCRDKNPKIGVTRYGRTFEMNKYSQM